jgi:hypothetical protein
MGGVKTALCACCSTSARNLCSAVTATRVADAASMMLRTRTPYGPLLAALLLALLLALCLFAESLKAFAATAADEMPPFSAPPTVPARCKFAVVGGGWSGVNTAWRLTVDTKRYRSDEVCLFEASSRWGGRVNTLRSDRFPSLQGLNLDLGAYRSSNYQRLPTDLIHGPLNLSSRCYLASCDREADEFNLTLRVLADRQTGEPVGYITAIEAMLRGLREVGVAKHLGTRLTAVYDAPVGEGDSSLMQLVWSDGSHTICERVLLNLPRNASSASTSAASPSVASPRTRWGL